MNINTTQFRRVHIRSSLLVRTINRAVLCSALAFPLALPPVVTYAQQETKTYQLPAGDLGAALSRFAAESGMVVYFDANLTRGLKTPGLSGEYRIYEGLILLLSGTELQVTSEQDGSYRIIDRQQQTLPLMRVLALEAITEDTGSYTTRTTNSSTGLSLSLRETPQSMTVMTHDRMEDQGLNEIADVMEQTVGIESDREGAIGSDGTAYYARGFEVQNYQVDGVSRPAGLYGFPEETADMVAYDRVEIIRGASGLMTGMGVPSATINLIRKRPSKDEKAYVSATTGSWDLHRIEADTSNSLNENGTIRGRVAVAHQENDTFVDREHNERVAVYGVVEADISNDTLLTVGLEYQDLENSGASRGGIPLFYSDGSFTNFSTSTNGGASWSNFNHKSLSLFTSLEHYFTDDWRIKFDYEHKDGSYDESFAYYSAKSIDASTGLGGTVWASRWSGDPQIDVFNINTQGNFNWLGRKHDLAFTLNHSIYENETPGYGGWKSYTGISAFDLFSSGSSVAKPDLSSNGDITNTEVKTTALSGVVRLKPTESTAVILGARISDWKKAATKTTAGTTIVTTGPDETGVVTPYVGIITDLTDNLSAYASYTSIFEPTTKRDLSAKTLDPLEGNSYELGVKGEFLEGHLNTSVSVFRMEQENFAISEGASTYVPGTVNEPAYRAESGAIAEGFELEISGRLLPNWQVAGGFAHAEVENNEGEALNTDIPINSFKFFSNYKLQGDLKSLSIGGNLRWQDKVFLEGIGPNGENFQQDSFALLDLMAKHAFSKRVTLTLAVNNVFDKKYYSAIYGRPTSTAATGGRYGAPRNYNLSVKYDF